LEVVAAASGARDATIGLDEVGRMAAEWFGRMLEN